VTQALPATSTNPVFAFLQKNRELLFPLAFVSLIIVILVPVPTWLMDLMLVVNLTLSIIVLSTTIYVKSPLEFAVFPSVLLAMTLFRLVLNVATTRLILTAADRADTPEQAVHSAGEMVMAFGSFVAGASLTVGVIIFVIIFIIQFVVITKGATRISEVAARFTLDAMPGKQMAIDADLNAGIINESEARRRRDEIAQEADFYGAMDGSSKFVRGDAIAASSSPSSTSSAGSSWACSSTAGLPVRSPGSTRCSPSATAWSAAFPHSSPRWPPV
jgi:flagellar biosynthesis protein FlhA